jgi:hypothetical protein
MNEVEISRIAAAISDLRPDWPAASIRSLLNRPELKNRLRRDVAVALTWVACEADTKTPARVIEAGPWWRAAAVEGDVTTTHTGKTVGRGENPHKVCGICDMWREDCERRTATSGHEFVARSECLPPTEVGPLGERGTCLAGPIDSPCQLITGHDGAHHCLPPKPKAPPTDTYLAAKNGLTA